MTSPKDETRQRPRRGVFGHTLVAYRRNFKAFLPSMALYTIIVGIGWAFLGVPIGTIVELQNSTPPPDPIEVLALYSDISMELALLSVVSIVVSTIISVRLLRIILFEGDPIQSARGISLGRLEFRFIGYTTVFFILIYIPFFVAAFIGAIGGGIVGAILASGASSDPEAAKLLAAGSIGIAIFLTMIGGGLVAAWISIKLLLMGPAVAADLPDGLVTNIKGSWAATKGHVWELSWNSLIIFGGYLVFLAGGVVVFFNVAPFTNTVGSISAQSFVQPFVAFFFYPLITTWVATAYRLYGGPLPDINEAVVLVEPEPQE